MITSTLDFYYKNFGFFSKTALILAGYVAYRLTMTKSYTLYDFVPIEEVEQGECFGLTAEEAVKYKACAQYLIELKKRLAPEDAQKIHGMIYDIDRSIAGGAFIFHSNMGIVNLTNQDIKTDKHGIIITISLLKHLSQNELKALLAHEVGHAVLNHTTRKKTLYREICPISFSIMMSGVFSLVDLAFLHSTLNYQNNREFNMLVAVIGCMFLVNAYVKAEIRKDEFAADRKSVVYNKDNLLLISALRKVDALHKNFSIDQLPPEPVGIYEETSGFFNDTQQNTQDGWTLGGKQGRSTKKQFIYKEAPQSTGALDQCMKYYQVLNANYGKILGIFAPYFSTHPTTEERVEQITKLQIMN